MSSAESTWPVTPARFIGHSTPSRTRIFLLREERPPRLQAVTTTSVAEADVLISALNDALWCGHTTTFDRLAEKLPQAVVTACREALNEFDHRSFALGYGGEPMAALREQTGYTWPDDGDLVDAAEGAAHLGLQVLFTNELDSRGIVCIYSTLLSDESWVPMEGPVSVWPAPSGTALIERRHAVPAEAFADPRWGTHLVRLHWVWHPEYPEGHCGTATAEWVMEVYDAPVPGRSEDGQDEEEPDLQRDASSRQDPPLDFEPGDWNPWPLTVRTRFVLYVALSHIADQLDEDIADLREGDSEQPWVMDVFPRIVQNQTVEWWEQLRESADRLAEAMRTGVQWNPRTPGEEALVHVAAAWEAGAVLDTVRDDPGNAITKTFLALPEATWEDDPETGERWQIEDLQFDEVLPALAEDADIELLWNPSMDGIDNPDADYRPPGMADLRAQSWHQPFDRYAENPDYPSFLSG